MIPRDTGPGCEILSNMASWQHKHNLMFLFWCFRSSMPIFFGSLLSLENSLKNLQPKIANKQEQEPYGFGYFSYKREPFSGSETQITFIVLSRFTFIYVFKGTMLSLYQSEDYKATRYQATGPLNSLGQQLQSCRSGLPELSTSRHCRVSHRCSCWDPAGPTFPQR